LSRNLTNIAKELRKRPTEVEKLLWRYLRGKRLGELKFRRQQPVGNYIVDFVCYDKKLVIELDGGQHAKNKAKDIKRDKWLQEHGFKVLRLWNNEVLCNVEGVLEAVKKSALFHPPPSPSHQGRGN